MMKRKTHNLNQQFILVISIFIGICIITFVLNYFSSAISNSVRAYIQGEGFWAKAEREAVLRLLDFSYSHDDSDHEKFERAIAIIMGDRQAREALLQKYPDVDLAEKGFLQGKNHLDDIPYMNHLLIYFDTFPHLKDAIEFWKQGEKKIDELIILSEALHHAIHQDDSAQKVAAFRLNILQLHDELSTIEEAFSTTLGEGARWLRRVITLITALILVVFFRGRCLHQPLHHSRYQSISEQ